MLAVGISKDRIVWEPLDKIRSWCRLPYPGHRSGCPNSADCQFFYDDLGTRVDACSYIMIVWVEFDLDAQARRMKAIHPGWTDRQCRNLLYWQRGLRSTLRKGIEERFGDVEIVMGAEGGGVNFHRTMRRLGVNLEMPKDLHTVRIIALVLVGVGG